MRLRRPNYSEQQALWFLAACILLGVAGVYLYDQLKP